MPWWLPALAVVNTGILCLWYLLHLVKKVTTVVKHPLLPYGSGPTFVEDEHNRKFPYDQV
jgi:hypothetical protein